MEVLLLKEFIKLFIFIQLIGQCCCIDKCDLRLSDPYWENDWNVYIKAVGPDRYELVRSQYVAVDKQIFGRCNNEKPPHSFTCDKNLRFTKDPLEPTPCTKDKSLEPVRKVDYSLKVDYCPYTLFKIGFNFKIGDRLQFMEAYQVCFDLKHMRPLYTINKAYPTAGVYSKFFIYNPDDIYNQKVFRLFSHDKMFKQVNTLLGPEQSYTRKSDPHNFVGRGQLTPWADFSITNLKRATFDMLNVIPQFQSIRSGNWKLLEDWARDPARTAANICTGVLDCNLDSNYIEDLHCVLQLKGNKGQLVPIFLGEERQIPIPTWTYKIVKNDKKAWVFLTFNNIYRKGKMAAPRRICKETECPSGLANHFTIVKLGRTFCCEYEHFIKKNVPHLRAVC